MALSHFFRITHQDLLTLSMLNLNISCFENSVEQDQLASKKPPDPDPHCFPLCLLVCLFV